MVMLDEMAAVFAEVARKGSSPINMALLPITKKGEEGYEVERVERNVHGFGCRPGGNVLHLRIRGKKVRVWSRQCIDCALSAGFSVERIRGEGKTVELRVFAKTPCRRYPGTITVEGCLRKRPGTQKILPLSWEPDPEVKAVAVLPDNETPACTEWPTYAKFHQGQTVWFDLFDFDNGYGGWSNPWRARVESVELVIGASLVYRGLSPDRGWVRFTEATAHASQEEATAAGRAAVWSPRNEPDEGESKRFRPGQIVFDEDGAWQIDDELPEEHWYEDHNGEPVSLYYAHDLSLDQSADDYPGPVEKREDELHELPPPCLRDHLRELQEPSEPEPATPPLPELEDNDPILQPPRRGDGKAVHFWRGAEFNHGSELLLATAISRFSESMPPYSGLVAVPNGVALLKQCRKTHRKPDFLVVLNENGCSITACVEVDGSSHEGRYLGDEARQEEFALNGFHHIKRFSAEKVEADPDAAVQELVAWMRSLRGTGTAPAF